MAIRRRDDGGRAGGYLQEDGERLVLSGGLKGESCFRALDEVDLDDLIRQDRLRSG